MLKNKHNMQKHTKTKDSYGCTSLLWNPICLVSHLPFQSWSVRTLFCFIAVTLGLLDIVRACKREISFYEFRVRLLPNIKRPCYLRLQYGISHSTLPPRCRGPLRFWVVKIYLTPHTQNLSLNTKEILDCDVYILAGCWVFQVLSGEGLSAPLSLMPRIPASIQKLNKKVAIEILYWYVHFNREVGRSSLFAIPS